MDLLTFINNGMQNPILDLVVPIIYKITDSHVLPIIILVLLVAAWLLKKEKLKKILLLCFVSIIITFGIVLVLKLYHVSPRPYSVLSNIRFVVPDNGLNSFPSGHMSISMSIITVLLMKIKEYKLPLTILSILYLLILAFSLLYAGVHYPLDIIVGATVGGLISVFTVFVSNKLFYNYFNPE